MMHGDDGMITTAVARLPQLLLLLFAAAACGTRAPARTPPLGFNTWVQFGMQTNSTILTDTAEAFVRLGLKDMGFVYVNSDDGWNGGREQGPCPNGTRPDGTCPGGKDLPHGAMRPSGGFPDGMRPVADHIHRLGLKLGLYTARHQRTCGNRAGSCMNELIDAQRWANWSVDYIKDDSCGSCRTDGASPPHADYAAQQAAIDSVDHEILFTTEGHPDVTKIFNTGCCGNVARVGTDLSPQWLAVMSLVDHGAELWPFAHNGSLGVNGSTSGFWNGIEMMGIGTDHQNGKAIPGWGDFVAERGPLAAAQARTHYSLFGIMKSHLLLSLDLTRVGNATLEILRKKEVIEVNQDSWGKQARRIDAQPPQNMSLLNMYPFNPIQIMQRCNSTNNLQHWRWRNITQVQNGKARNGSVLFTLDPHTGNMWCLGDSGPFSPAATPRGPELCNVTEDQLLRGTVRGWNFSLRTDGHFNVSDGPGTRDTAQLAYSMQPFASGPVPHSRWLMGDKFQDSVDKNGNHNGNPPAYRMSPGPYIVDLHALASEAGGMIRSADTTAIIDDDNAGTVAKGGDFCVAAHSGAALEVWAGLLSPSHAGEQRWAVALVNRSPSTDFVVLEFAKLPDLQLVGLGQQDMASGSFMVQDAWLNTNHTDIRVEWQREIDAHDTALLIVTKTA